jgi:hypothetical protein
MRRVVKNQVFQSRVINQLGPAKLSPSRNRGHNSNNNAAEGVIIINVWHTRVVSDYPYFGGSSTTATPQRIWIQDLVIPTNWTSYTMKRDMSPPFQQMRMRVYYVHIVRYGDSDAYSTQDFCVKVK